MEADIPRLGEKASGEKAMSCAFIAVAAAVAAALLTMIVTGWMIWRDRSEDTDSDFLIDESMEDEL